MKQDIQSTLDLIRRWHLGDMRYGFFDLVSQSTKEPLKWFEELAYWNYSGWHRIEEFPDSALESMRVNRSRCEVMDKIDQWHCGARQIMPDAFAVVNTETFGSLIDRIVNHQIKYLHADRVTVKGTLLTGTLLTQLDQLVDAAVQLDSDCAAGRRYTMAFSRVKINMPKELG